MRVVATGANRGIGLEFARRYPERGVPRAALNMACRSTAPDLQGEGFRVVVLSPGCGKILDDRGHGWAW